MSSGEVLRHQVRIDEEEVFSLIGEARTLPELQPSNFSGREALWAQDVELKYGDSITPIMTYTENGPHRVSWIRHEGNDYQTGEAFCKYHIICDCVGGTEGNSPREIVQQIIGCRAINQALQRRAAFVDYTYRTREILDSFKDSSKGDFEQSNAFHMFAVKTVANILELDVRKPREWPANIINGEHQASVLATMFQLHPEVIKWYGTILADEGFVEFDGETIRLTDDVVKELMAA